MEHEARPKSAAATTAPATTPAKLFATATGGAATTVPFRAELEQAFGEDFGSVRAYLGAPGVGAGGLGADGVTDGEKIAFASASPTKHVVAHELAHVVQARKHGGVGAAPVSAPSDAHEQEAEALAARAARGEKVTATAAPGAKLNLRGPAFTADTSVALPAHTHVMIVDPDIDSREALRKRAQAGGTVTVKLAGGTQRALPAAQVDDTTFTPTPDINPHIGKHAQSKFSRQPKGVRMDGADLIVDIGLETRNVYDRASWHIELAKPGAKAGRRLAEDKTWWNNPKWNAGEMNADAFNAYSDFKPGFKTLPAHGTGTIAADRTMLARVPGSELEAEFGKGAFKKSSAVVVGMKVQYDALKSIVTADEAEFDQVFGGTGQYHGEGIFRNREDGLVDLSAVDIPEGDFATDKQVWQKPLQDNPIPNVERAFPNSKLQTEVMRPLVPEDKRPSEEFGTSGLKLQTRIENEATLHLSSLGSLRDLVAVLDGLVKTGDIDRVMKAGGHPLAQFDWTLTSDENSMVFTDKYMDDPAMHALRSGVGIRHRSTDIAHKLNVKTGEGHRVGKLVDKSTEPGDYEESGEKSDIYRRHEIGFTLNPDATPQQVGAYLDSGVGGGDSWNKAGDEANGTVDKKLDGQKIDYKALDYRMVLQGDRKKFKLSAKKGSGPPINIEISCDHTVGRTFPDYEKDKGVNVFDDPEGKYKHVYNVEMELEHLGVAKPKEDVPQQPKQEVVPQPKLEGVAPKKVEAPIVDDKPAPPGHPGRMYLSKDTQAPQFNTPSFQVFARAQERFVAYARNEAPVTRDGSKDGGKGARTGLGGDELGNAPQKLEALYKQLEPKLLPDGPPKAYPEFQAKKTLQLFLDKQGLAIVPIEIGAGSLYKAAEAMGLGSAGELKVAVEKELTKKLYNNLVLEVPKEAYALATLKGLDLTIVDHSGAAKAVGARGKTKLMLLNIGGKTNHYFATRAK